MNGLRSPLFKGGNIYVIAYSIFSYISKTGMLLEIFSTMITK